MAVIDETATCSAEIVKFCMIYCLMLHQCSCAVVAVRLKIFVPYLREDLHNILRGLDVHISHRI